MPNVTTFSSRPCGDLPAYSKFEIPNHSGAHLFRFNFHSFDFFFFSTLSNLYIIPAMADEERDEGFEEEATNADLIAQLTQSAQARAKDVEGMLASYVDHAKKNYF
jgi:hypothetical protein